MSTIEITNLGPIESATLPFIKEGGVVVLRGRQGAGKSTVLDALDAVAKGKGSAPLRDGARAGTVHAFGATLKLSRTTRHSGEPEVVSLEGRLSVADLVDPRIKGAEAADRKRIAALVSLSGVTPKVSMFESLLNAGQMTQLEVACSADDDLISMARKAKGILDTAALLAERQADHARGQAAALTQDVDEALLEASSPDDAQAALEVAIRKDAALREQAAAAIQTIHRAALARDALDVANDNTDAPDVPEAKRSILLARDKQETARVALAKAEAYFTSSIETTSRAVESLQAAERYETVATAWLQEIQAAEGCEPVSEEFLADASAAVTSARQGIELATLKQKYEDDVSRAKKQRDLFRQRTKEAASLRTCAQLTDAVLTDVVGTLGTPLRVEDGRLILDTDRGATLFADLSIGERWIPALNIAIDAVGEGGLIVIPQGAWGELQPANRTLIALHLRERKVLAYTAQATDDEELNAEIL